MSVINAHTVLYDSVDIRSVNGLSILAVDFGAPKKTLSIFPIARRDANKVTSGFYKQKNITLRISISQPTRALVEASVDSLNALLVGVEKTMRVTQSGSSREYTCSIQDVVPLEEGGAYYEANYVFTCSDIYGYDISYTTLGNVTASGDSSLTSQFTVGGSAEWQMPYITLTLNAVTGGSNASMSFGNDATGQTVTITRTWSAVDVVIIDTLNNIVYVNGTQVDVSGALPKFKVGTGFLTRSDTFTTRNVTYSIVYKKRWS